MGQTFLGESQSRIYPNMCAKFGCGSTIVSERGGGGVHTDKQTDKGTLQLYSRLSISSRPCSPFMVLIAVIEDSVEV